METEESNRCATPCKTLITQDEALNTSFPPHWSTPIQVYHNSGSTATTFVNSYTADFSLNPNIWANRKYNIPLQYDSQHSNKTLSNHLVSEGTSLTISEREQSIFNEKEIDSRKSCDVNLHPRSIITGKSTENGNGPSMHYIARDGPSCMSSFEGHGIDDTNNNEFSIDKQQCEVMLTNEDDAEKEATDTENFNTVHMNRNSASEDIAVNSTELNANLGNNVTEAKPRVSKLEEDEMRRERKRQLNRESARRSRIRKQQELEELQNTVDNLIRENSALKKKLMKLSEDCMELTDSNDSIERELVEEYGPGIIADLVATKPARITSDESPKTAQEAPLQNPSIDVAGHS
ncbi:light-inducible protein CPRF3-like [Prosopis cineraria]|uniref:light-inducible protein CPRF3-like n=1 Tax=Prosopis cineraria TaxID=364024 RepID=UPI0024104062|nr:light-inducible protein CPRF3-like [Prosopis cineraria]